MPNFTKISGALILCHTCDTLYLPGHGVRLSDPLPCGHTNVSYMMPSAVFSSARDADFVDWAGSNGYLSEAIEGLRDAGGDFDPNATGPARLTLPGRKVQSGQACQGHPLEDEEDEEAAS